MAHSIGKTIAGLRKAKCWTQIELAEKLNISDKTVSKWESEGGFPEITQLPVLAKIFDVSIDYLMTGKSVEPQIIVMSRSAYCAKMDDAKLANEIDITFKDEDGKTLIDYVFEYKALNVFAAICEKKEFKLDIEKYGINRLYKYALLANKINILNNYNFKKHYHVSDEEFCNSPHHLRYKMGKWCVINDDTLDLIVMDNRINNDTISYLLSDLRRGMHAPSLTCNSLPHLLHRAYFHSNLNLVDYILQEVEKSNINVYQKLHPIEDDRQHKNFVEQKGVEYAIWSVLRKTINLAISRKDFQYLEKFYNINNEIKNFDKRLYLRLEYYKRV